MNMQKKGPLNFPSEILLLTGLGERLKLARLRRRYTTTLVAKRCGISRTTLAKVEKGDPSVTFGTYLRVLSVLGLVDDIAALAADDKLGRKLQDLELTVPKGTKS
jgi:transcriptional regulator with XRE-family HTH domain